MTTSAVRTPPVGAGALATALRVAVILSALAVLVQAVFAGQILSGVPGAVALHSTGAAVSAALVLVQTVLAVVAWRLRQTTGRVAALSGGLLVAVIVQAVAGGAGALALHIPLGVALFGGFAALLASVWRR